MKRHFFRLVQIESIFRRQHLRNLEIDILLGWVESIVGKGENAGYQHFLLFSQGFQKASFSVLLRLPGLQVFFCGTPS